MAWLPLTSTTVEPARLDMERWASGGIILSSVAIIYQLGLAFHAGSLILPLRTSHAPRDLRVSHESGSFCVHIGCEGSAELPPVEEQIAVLRRQYRRYGCAGRR